MSTGEVGIIIGCSLDSKLKPRVLRVLDSNKSACRERVIDLACTARDLDGKPYRIREVHGSGAFGIDIEVYRLKGLTIPAGL